MARPAEKIAISLDADVLAAAERLRRQTGESRSALVARALRELLETAKRQQRIEEYLGAYRRIPETTREVSLARKLARKSTRGLRWDE
jgi:metal-responsive CopG/Arc/MetJ family transcriptional regulator